ncbi:hypothetical protein BH09BAC5_BH09BAC5_12780 [soil metagenome]
MNSKFLFRFLFCLSGVFVWTGLSSQNLPNQHKIDSLSGVVSNSLQDTVKVRVLDMIVAEYRQVNERASSIQSYKEEFAIQEKLLDRKGMATTLRRMGNNYYHTAIYDKAMDYYLQSIKICIALKDKKNMASCYNNMGIVYAAKGDLSGNEADYKQSIIYHEKSLALLKEIGESYTLPLLNIAHAYIGLGQFDNALTNYQISFEQFSKIDNKNGIDLSLVSMGETYLSIGKINNSKKDFEKAREIFEERLNSYVPGVNERKIQVICDLGETYFRLNNSEKALLYLTEALDTARRYHFLAVERDAALFLADLYSSRGEYQKAFQYSKLSYALKDSLVNEKSNSELVHFKVAFETAEKESQIQGLEKDNRISSLEIKNKDAELFKGRIFVIASFIAIGLLLGVAFLLFNRYKLKKKANSELSLAYNLIEKKNRQITDSITYAKRIQDSILPTEEMLKKKFSESFIFFQPRDIVSGDFYWLSEQNDLIFIAVADCTGHGVPGAFMSMIGNTLLNEIVNEKGIYEPDEILARLDIGISTALQQNNNTEINSQDDGMDISLCVIDKKSKTISFSAANHSLYVFRKGISEIIEGDIFSIGGIFGRDEKKFFKKQVQMDEFTSVFMMTDGYADQFGGPQNKKFMTNELCKLMGEIVQKNVEEQKKILADNFSVWKGEQKQLDDVLVIGFKF